VSQSPHVSGVNAIGRLVIDARGEIAVGTVTIARDPPAPAGERSGLCRSLETPCRRASVHDPSRAAILRRIAPTRSPRARHGDLGDVVSSGALELRRHSAGFIIMRIAPIGSSLDAPFDQAESHPFIDGAD
jgi:hypothetical protein